jgi:hypothetical protein
VRHRRGLRVPVGEQHGERRQQGVPLAGCTGRRGVPHGLGHVARAGAGGEPSGEQRRGECIQVGVPREPRVKWFESAGGRQEQ